MSKPRSIELWGHLEGKFNLQRCKPRLVEQILVSLSSLTYQGSTTFQCGSKQKMAPHEILESLKGVVPHEAQIGCGQTLSLSRVILENFLKVRPATNKLK